MHYAPNAARIAAAVYELASALTAHSGDADTERAELCDEIIIALEQSPTLEALQLLFPTREVDRRLNERPDVAGVRAHRKAFFAKSAGKAVAA